MEKLTYKEFEKEINKMGCHSEESYYFIYVKHGLTVVAAIDKENLKNLNLSFDESLCVMEESERIKIADLCWRLASTPLKDRVEPKKYHLRVKPRFRPWFVDGYDYLKKSRMCDTCWTSDNEDNNFQQTIFTEVEIEELRKSNDLVLFEKVEVDDE